MNFAEVTIARRDFEALARKTHGAIGATLPTLDFDAKGIAQRIAARTVARDVGTLGHVPKPFLLRSDARITSAEMSLTNRNLLEEDGGILDKLSLQIGNW
jgi:hypothetical protein